MSGPILPIIISFLPVKGAIKWKRWWQLKTWGLMRCGWFILRSGTADNVIAKRKLQIKVILFITNSITIMNDEKQRWGEWTSGPLYLVALWVPPSPFFQKMHSWMAGFITHIHQKVNGSLSASWHDLGKLINKCCALITCTVAFVQLINFALLQIYAV